MTQTILLVEDDAHLARSVEESLTQRKYNVVRADCGQAALTAVRDGKPDLVVLDIGLPDIDGFQICREIRQGGAQTPIIFLSVHEDEVDRIVAFELGADDYVTKPFSLRELSLRIGACLRRCAPTPHTKGARFGDIEIEFVSKSVVRAGTRISLTLKEYDLLVYLVRHAGQTISREELIREVWHYESTWTRTVDTHIGSLRRKLDPAAEGPEYIASVYGGGYRFEAEDLHIY